MGLAILMCELLRLAYIICTGVLSVYNLPLHLCGLAVFFCFIHSLSGGETLGNLLYSTCMPGAAFALVFPDWTDFGIMSFRSVVGFIVHSLIVAYPLMLVLSGELRPRISKLPACLAILLGLAAAIYVFDRCFSANYMFLLVPAAGSPLEWFESLLGNPGYLLGYLPMTAVIWSLLYFPFRGKRAS